MKGSVKLTMSIIKTTQPAEKTKGMIMESFECSVNQAAAFFGVNRGTLYDWIRKGCPKAGRGRVDLKAVHEWWFENIAEEKARAASGDDSLNEAKRRFWWLKAESEELRIKKEKELLLSKSEIEKGWAWRMSEYKSGCENMEKALPPLLEGKTTRDMRKIIGDYVWSMFDRVCRTGHFCPAPKKTPEKSQKCKRGL